MMNLLRICFVNVYVPGNYRVRICFSTNLDLPLLKPDTAIFNFLAETDKCVFKIIKHLLLIFKVYISESREKASVDICRLTNKIRKIKTIEKKLHLPMIQRNQ